MCKKVNKKLSNRCLLKKIKKKKKRTQNKTGQNRFLLTRDRFLVGVNTDYLGLPSLCQFRVQTPMLSPFLHGDRMYQYTVFATVAKQEIELKTFFDDLDEKPMEKAKALVEANKGKFRSMRIEKRITPML